MMARVSASSRLALPMTMMTMIAMLLLLHSTSAVAVKPGSCPTPPPGAMGTCDEACADDESCPGEQKCCSNGCGHGCVQPQVLGASGVKLPVLKPTQVELGEASLSDGTLRGKVRPEVRPGCCQDPDPFPIPRCKWRNDLCRGDGECPGVQKCCPHSCGNRCENVKPVKPKPGECPFVDTRLIRCAYRPPLCSADWQCPGEQKCCNTGCVTACSKPAIVKPGSCPAMPVGLKPTCDIRCLNDDSCPDNQKCCSNGCGRQCLRPASGIGTPKPGQCPFVSSEPILCESRRDRGECSADSQCPSEQKCCNTGCTMACTTPAKVVKIGMCPVHDYSGINCFRYENGCSGDASCPGNQMCCSVTCGVGCVEPEPVVKAGRCPIRRDTFLTIGCSGPREDCTGDAGCPGKQKCCLAMCGVDCVDPAPESIG
ncbi:balbiani ring protein 3-like isoform X1 [Lethenteron reissneri]|uniref:balbiani ring protein 3-like isoform X1 n=1 Tax=Lethenteron reissneri TaxID=7753 RepID=UPI002AB65AAE|nr:balbiani ring protein 3-like isoform X1 [Lethenteron reissneri]